MQCAIYVGMQIKLTLLLVAVSFIVTSCAQTGDLSDSRSPHYVPAPNGKGGMVLAPSYN